MTDTRSGNTFPFPRLKGHPPLRSIFKIPYADALEPRAYRTIVETFQNRFYDAMNSKYSDIYTTYKHPRTNRKIKLLLQRDKKKPQPCLSIPIPQTHTYRIINNENIPTHFQSIYVHDKPNIPRQSFFPVADDLSSYYLYVA